MQACGRQAKRTPIPVPCTLLCYHFVQLFLSFLALALSLCPNISCRLFLVAFGLLFLSLLALLSRSLRRRWRLLQCSLQVHCTMVGRQNTIGADKSQAAALGCCKAVVVQKLTSTQCAQSSISVMHKVMFKWPASRKRANL